MDEKSTLEIYEAERPKDALIEKYERALREIAGSSFGMVSIDNYKSLWASKASTIDVAAKALGEFQE